MQTNKLNKTKQGKKQRNKKAKQKNAYSFDWFEHSEQDFLTREFSETQTKTNA